jgi:hypothetical protein
VVVRSAAAVPQDPGEVTPEGEAASDEAAEAVAVESPWLPLAEAQTWDEDVACAMELLFARRAPTAGIAKARATAPPHLRRSVAAASRDAAACECDEVGRDDFDVLSGALVDVALGAGATRAAAAIPRLLRAQTLEAGMLDENVVARLQAAGIIERAGSTWCVTSQFDAMTAAWRGVLQGTSADLSACGTTTLDTWASDLLDALAVQVPSGNPRRELRRRGVAAFGVLAVA